VTIKTDIGYSTRDRIVVRGKDLPGEVIGKLDFIETICLLALGRVPEAREKTMLNALLVTAADHGLTPITLAARLTLLGAPESLQGAIAAGLLGGGNTFLGTTQNVCEMLASARERLPNDPDDALITKAADDLVAASLGSDRGVPGYGHPIHTRGDPRVPALAELSTANGYFGVPWRLAYAIEESLSKQRRRRLPLNAAGAMGAIYAELRLPPLMARGLALVGRCGGLVAHLLEEQERPIAREVWDLVLAQDRRGDEQI